MRAELTCGIVSEEALAERYATGALRGDDLERFEAHILECRQCQDEVRQAVAIREGLRASEEDGPGSGGTDGKAGADFHRRVKRIPSLVWVPVAAAAALAGFLLLTPERVPSRISDLGRVEQAPVYLGIPVRQEAALADSLFDTAMLRYLADDFRAAATGLEEALAAGFDPVPARFFLGSSFLMLDRPSAAAEALGAVIDSGESPYLPEAHYYRAKALLRLGSMESALRDLRAAAATSAEISGQAQALADSIEAHMGG